MYVLIGYAGKDVLEAVVLAMTRDHIRVAAAGFADVLELSRSNDRWFADNEPVHLDFLFACDPASECRRLSDAALSLGYGSGRVLSAGYSA